MKKLGDIIKAVVEIALAIIFLLLFLTACSAAVSFGLRLGGM